MPSPFSNGVQNADKVFDILAEGKVKAGASALTTAQTSVAIAHGLGAAPDFVLVTDSANVHPSWAATATTLTITSAETNAASRVSYIAGILA